MLEVMFYVHHRAQVKLYIVGIVNELKEKQLIKVMDSAPDKILVCS